jgi:hypothetical protein
VIADQGGPRSDGSSRLEVDEAWRASVTMLGIGVIGAGINLVLWGRLAPGMVRLSQWVWLGTFDLGALAALVALRRHLGARWVNGLLLTGVAFAYLAGWRTTAQLAASGRSFEPFTTFKTVALVVALAAPWRKPLAVASTAAAGALAVAQYYASSEAARAAMPFAEPWLTGLVAGTCAILCFYRIHASDLARRAHRAQAEAASFEGFARLCVSVRHLANTPLQTIEAQVAILRAARQVGELELERLERALDRLRRVSRLLAGFEGHLRWQHGEESLDAEELLAAASARDAGSTAGSRRGT